MAFRILIVDDSSIIRSVVKKTILMAGVEVKTFHEADNGLNALKVLADNPVDMVFTDLNMPQMTGMELVASIRQSETLSALPVVVVSSKRDPKQQAELKDQGINGYIAKPFRPEEFRDIINEVLGQQTGERHE